MGNWKLIIVDDNTKWRELRAEWVEQTCHANVKIVFFFLFFFSFDSQSLFFARDPAILFFFENLHPWLFKPNCTKWQKWSRLRGMYLMAFSPVNNYYFLEDWQALCVLIGELYQNGALSSQHVKVIFIMADF